MVRRCLGTNVEGEPCSAYVPAGESWCRWHDPSREAEREEWRRRGGANRANQARARKQLAERVMTITDIDALLCEAIAKVAAGRMEPGVGTSMATIAKTIAGIRSVGEMERRLEQLEQSVGLSSVRRMG